MPRSKKATSDASAGSARSPRASVTAYVPSWEVPVVLKGVEWGTKAAVKLSEWLKKEGALAIQILDSRQDGTDYKIEFRATNMSIHGIYICSAKLTWPYDTSLELKAIRSAVSFGDAPDANPPSRLIGSWKAMEFSFTFPVPKRADLNAGVLKRGLGTAQLEYWSLDEAGSKERSLGFAVRLAAADQ